MASIPARHRNPQLEDIQRSVADSRRPPHFGQLLWLSPTSRRVTRRTLLDWLLGTSLGAVVLSVLYPVFRYVMPPEQAEVAQQRVQAGELDTLPPNSGKIVRFGADAVIVIRTPRGDVRAFSAVCTHLSCTVQYRRDLERIWCPCHDGQFDLQGVPVKGPPPKPLRRFDAEVEGGVVFVSRGGA